MNSCYLLFAVIYFIKGIYAPPTKVKLPEEENEVVDNELSVEYKRYLKEVVTILEGDQKFREELEKADPEEIRSGKIADKLDLVGHNVRSLLDETKRQEVNRLNKLANRSQKLGIKMPHGTAHLNLDKPDNFEIGDLKKLILQTANDMEKADEQRKKEFKEYEIKKEFERRQQMQNLTTEEKEAYNKKHEDKLKKHKNHPKIHHPGSEAQLQEVWEQEDHLKPEEFDPKTFFYIHDIDGNGYWDVQEVNALFINELRKVYDENTPEDEMRERYEDMERMREHVFSESDHNRDGLISFEEFLKQTQKSDFKEDEAWKGVDQEEIFSEDDLRQWGSEHGYQYLEYPSASPYAPAYRPVGGEMHQAGIPPSAYPNPGHPPQLNQQFQQQQQFQQFQQQQFQQQFQPQQPQLQNMPPQPPQQFINPPSSQQFQNVPPVQYQNAPQQQFQNVPQQQFQNAPQQQFQNAPQQQFQNTPQQQFQNAPQQPIQNAPQQHLPESQPPIVPQEQVQHQQSQNDHSASQQPALQANQDNIKSHNSDPSQGHNNLKDISTKLN